MFLSPLSRSLLLSHCLAFSLFEPVSPRKLSLSRLSHRFKISLSLPPLALSAMPIPPSRPLPHFDHLLLLLLGLSLSLSLTCFLSFPLCLCHPLTLLIFLSHLLFPLPQAFCFTVMPLPAHLLSYPDSLTPPPPASVTPAKFPLPFVVLLQSLPFLSLSSVLFLHVGELSGTAGTTGRGRKDTPPAFFLTGNQLHKCSGNFFLCLLFEYTPSSLFCTSHDCTQTAKHFSLHLQHSSGLSIVERDQLH